MEKAEREGMAMDTGAKLNPKFPYKMEKVKWYLLFMWMKGIITENEYKTIYNRLPYEYR